MARTSEAHQLEDSPSRVNEESTVPPLPWTGERFIPGEGGPEIYYEHAHRYLLARNLLAGAVVVDLASGEGYGAGWIAEVAKSVTGIDVDAASVVHSHARYGRHGNLDFTVGDIQSLPFASDSVDAVTCFEAIEHVENPRAVVAEVVRILRPGGLFIVSTPNKAVYADERDYNNEFHVHEFYLPDLELLLGQYFVEHELVGQRLVMGSLTWWLGDPPSGVSDAGIGLVVAPGFRESGEHEPATMVEPMYVMAACRLAGTPRTQGRLPAGSILVDPEELLLDFYRRGDARADDIDAHNREKDVQLERARAQLAAYEEQATVLRRRVRQLDEQVAGQPSRLAPASAAESDFLQDRFTAQQALAARLSADLAAATELNLRLLSELHTQQSVLAAMQLSERGGGRDPSGSKLPSGVRSLKSRLVPSLPGIARLRRVARQLRRLVPWR